MVKETLKSGARIRSFLLLIGGSMIFAVAVVALLTIAYSPSGRYIAGSLLPGPDLIKQLSYSEGSTVYRFDQVIYSYFDKRRSVWRRDLISEGDYAVFYNAVAKDESIAPAEFDASHVFQVAAPSQMELIAKSGVTSRVFLHLEISRNDGYYRISLRDGGWAVFYHEGIGTLADDLFIQKQVE